MDRRKGGARGALLCFEPLHGDASTFIMTASHFCNIVAVQFVSHTT